MSRWSAACFALTVLLASGLVHGHWADRWQQSHALTEAVARVGNAPLNCGAWTGQILEPDLAAFERAGAQGYWMRRYTHLHRRGSVVAILMCGRAGRMSVHTPEICYQGAGYDMMDDPRTISLASEEGADLGSMWTARFVKAAGRGKELRLYWAWSSGKLWQAAVSPRWEFRGEPFLYKLYVSYDGPAPAPNADETAQLFLRQFLPELRRTLEVH